MIRPTSILLTRWWNRLTARPKEVPTSNERAAFAGTISPVTILNSDDEVTSLEGLTWLLKCIFREADLLEYASEQVGSALARCRTFGEANRFLYDYFQRRSRTDADSPLSSLDGRVLEAIAIHQKETALNRSAYEGRELSSPLSGFWPNPSDQRNGRSLFQELPYRRSWKIITKKTPLVSAGSCFALEIAHELQRAEFNYLITERNSKGFLTKDTSVPSDASAAWGIIFNTPSFRQLVERAFGLRQLPRILWQLQNYYMDPFREEMRFHSIDEYLANYDPHTEAARAAFLKADVLIITLGLNEIWSFKMDGSVFARSPWRIAPSFVEHRTLTVEENVRDLERMLKILREHNPNLQLIVSLSPVPLHATFLYDRYHVVEANMHSKAVLRVAAQEFVDRHEGVYYFPSFELVTHGFENPWAADHRHVNRAVVARVMEMFHEMFVT
jgi:GSCFA family